MPAGRDRSPTPGVPGSDVAPGPRPLRRRLGDPTVTLIGGLFLVLLVVGAALALAEPGASLADVLPLLVAGVSIWLTLLGGLSNPFLSTLGIFAGTVPLALTLHLLLAFPSGRVQNRFARLLVGLGYLASTVLQLPVVLIGSGPVAVWRPAGAASIQLWASWLQTTVGVFSVVAAAGLVAVQAVRSDPRERRLLGPMVWYRVVLLLVIAVGAIACQLGQHLSDRTHRTAVLRCARTPHRVPGRPAVRFVRPRR